MDVDMEKEIAEFCKKNHITKMMSYTYPFHSAAGKDSVLDFLVDFEPDHTPGYFDMTGGPGLIGIEEELALLLGKKYVYLNTYAGIGPHFRSKALDDARAMAEPFYPAPETA